MAESDWQYELHSKEEIQELSQLAVDSFSSLRDMREQREELLAACTGTDYIHSPDRSSKKYTLVNVMSEAEIAHITTLASEVPRVNYTARRQEGISFGQNLTRSVNKFAHQMNLRDAMQEVARNSFTCMGILYIFQERALAVQVEADERMDPGRACIISVSPHHFNFDFDAPNLENARFISHRYWVRKKDILNDDAYPDSIKRLVARDGHPVADFPADQWGQKRLSRQNKDYIYLANVFLPHEQVIYTFVTDSSYRFLNDEPIHLEEWQGREEGPYHTYIPFPVPDKILPVPPALNIERLGKLSNSIYRKLEQQARAMKQVNVGIAADKVDVVKRAKHGDWVPDVSPQDIGTIRSDGPDNQLFGFGQHILEMFNMRAGNPQQRLGLGGTEGTASQEQLIAANSNQYNGFLYGRWQTFANGVMRELGRMLWEDTETAFMTEVPMSNGPNLQVPWVPKGENYEIEGRQQPGRVGEYDDYEVEVFDSSGGYKSNQQRIQELQQSFGEIMQLMPMLEPAGMVPNINYYLERKAELLNNPDLNYLLQQLPQAEGQEQPGGQQQSAPAGPNEPRRYIHEGAGNGSGSGQAPPEAQSLMQSPPPQGQSGVNGYGS